MSDDGLTAEDWGEIRKNLGYDRDPEVQAVIDALQELDAIRSLVMNCESPLLTMVRDMILDIVGPAYRDVVHGRAYGQS